MTNDIKAGDRVQHKAWKGDVSTRGHEVACVTKVLGEPHAILEGGSAWPCSELVKMPAEEIKPGDCVTHRDGSWDGGETVSRVEHFEGGESIVYFEGGGFWRYSQLVKMPPESTEYQIQLEKDWAAQYLGPPTSKMPIPGDPSPATPSEKPDWWYLASEASEAITAAMHGESIPLRRMKLTVAKLCIQDALDALPPANEIHVEGK